MSNGFVKIDNSIVDNKNLSFDAKGIYMTLVRYYSIPNFKLNKTHIKSVTGLGEIRFNRAWKELKENNILIQKKKSVNGRFEYEYIVKTHKSTKAKTEKPTVPVEEKPIDSDGNAPLDGQIYIDDVVEDNQEEKIKTEVVANNATTENIKLVVEETGLNDVQAKKLLKTAKNDVDKVIKAYEYTLQQSGIKNIYAYTRWIIKNSNVLSIKTRPFENEKQDSFNDYNQRVYDFSKLEKALLYGEQYDLPI